MKKNQTWSALAKFLSKEASLEEEEGVAQWMEAHPGNRQLAEDTEKITRRHRLDSPHFDTDRGKKLLRSKMNASTNSGAGDSIKTVWMRWAAAIILSASVTTYFLTQHLVQSGQVVHTAIPGEKTAFRLPDGTFVRLNAGSVLSYNSAFNKKDRNISLTGEAFFDVHPDRERPFEITAGELKVRVLGTAFNVKAYSDDDEFTVAVSRGKVRVQVPATNQYTDLVKEQKADYEISTQTLSKNATDLTMELAWMENNFVFRNTPVGKVAEALERTYGVPVRFQNEKIKRCIVTGKFEDSTLRRILMTICYSNELEYEFHEGYVMLKGKGC